MITGTAHALVSLVLPAWLDWLKKNCYSTIVLIKHFVKPPLSTPCYHLTCSVQHACILSLLTCLSWTCHSKTSLQSWWHRVESEQIRKGWWQHQQSWYGAMVAAAVHEVLTSHYPHACTWLPIAPVHQDWASEIFRQILVCYGCAKSFGAGEKQIENW